jgi:hypothetical protein
MLRLHLQIHKVIQKERRRRAQDTPPVVAEKKKPWDLPGAEITLLEQSSVLHTPPSQNNQYRQEDRDAVHGMERDGQITPTANQAHQIDKGANRTAGRGHERRDKNLYRATFGIKMLV